MFPYFFVLFLVMFFVFFEKSILKRDAFVIPFLILVLFSTIRDYSVGTDTEVYTSFFRSYIDVSNYNFDKNLEYGYQFLVYCILGFTKSYFYLFLITSIIIVFNTLYIIRKYSVNYAMSMYIYITFSFYTFFFNTLRQGIAISICMLGMYYFVHKKTCQYLIIVLFASLFHIASLVMIPMYFLINFIKLRIELKAVFAFIFSYFGANLIINFMAADNVRYEHYARSSDNAGGYLLILFYIALAIFIYLSGKLLRLENNLYNKIEQIYIVGLCAVVPVVFIGTDPSGPQRILYYFSFYLIFILPMIFSFINNKLLSFIFVLFSMVFYFFVTGALYGIYPYKLNEVFHIF